MAEFLYAGNNTNGELRNAKSKQNIQQVTPDQTSPFSPGKICAKIQTLVD